MKWLSLILAFLILGLSAQPVCAAPVQAEQCCADDMDCRGDEHNADKKKDCEGACNPFQQCSCCVVAMILPIHPAVPAPLIFSSAVVHYSTLPTAHADEPVKGFWQPPRMIPYNMLCFRY